MCIRDRPYTDRGVRPFTRLALNGHDCSHQRHFDGRGCVVRLSIGERNGSEAVSYTHLDVYKRQPDDRVESIPILNDAWVILTRRDSEIAEIEHPSFEILHGRDVVAWNRKWQVQAELEDAWIRRGIAPRIVYRTDDNLALQRLVAAGLGHACICLLYTSRCV